MIKSAQVEMSEKLGNSLRYAETQNENMLNSVKQKEEDLRQLTADHELQKANIEDQQNNIREEVGYYDRTIRDTNKKLKEYQGQNIDAAVEKFNEREQLQVELNIARKEYESLTSNVQSLELKFTSLFEQVQNEKNAYLNTINSRISQLSNDYNERQLLTKNDFNRKENDLKDRRNKMLAEVNPVGVPPFPSSTNWPSLLNVSPSPRSSVFLETTRTHAISPSFKPLSDGTLPRNRHQQLPW